MGNSEVGHMNLGAGRIVYQDLVRIDLALEDGSFAHNPVFAELAQRGAAGQRIHLLGLVSDGGVHSHINHAKGILSALHSAGASHVFVHAFTDGRDTDPQSGAAFIGDLEAHMSETTGSLASLTGRYYAMDRDKRWERTKLAWDAIVHGIGEPKSVLPSEAMAEAYEDSKTDEFLLPMVFETPGKKLVRDGDVVLFFNFRADRVRQLSETFLTEGPFKHFKAGRRPKVHYVTLTQYDANYQCDVIFGPDKRKMVLGETVAKAGKNQMRIAETEKYPHVTYFFNGGVEKAYKGEDADADAAPGAGASGMEMRPTTVSRSEASLSVGAGSA
jgi:2,3-bisphosphoglycerate-independent phosphoglycerate mutase